MFQTGINHFLQNFDNTQWIYFMEGISALGSRNFYLLFVFVLLFSMEFRMGFIVLQCLLWSNFLTLWLKDLLNMPRPYHVDADLKVFENLNGTLRLKNADAVSFFSTLPEHTLTQLRNSGKLSNGFPSGHTSSAASFWITTGIIFRKKWVLIFAIGFVFLTMISRLYLAQHFLADVLAGLFIGLLPVFIAFYSVIRWKALENWLAIQFWKNKESLFLWVAPFFLLLLPDAPVSTIGTIVGLNLGAWLACRNGFPSSSAALWKRVARFFAAVLLFTLIDLFFSRVIPGSTNEYVLFLKNALEFGLFFFLTTALCLKLKLFESRLTEVSTRS
jgi:membrane-associated phospholipid phosphatase